MQQYLLQVSYRDDQLLRHHFMLQNIGHVDKQAPRGKIRQLSASEKSHVSLA